ncbi:heat shock factor protein 1 isoform X2 [Orussus abietinus]|uniref:heat shock factor protein 1 isoform X2 n=1 Tax=Orussus abietinus TaxID=222816 RepID=UPI0006262324|nr:heat shock factor protein 1 isoform X2 [Orussus abietinus]
MHPIMELGTSVPAFLGKLWKLVEDPETDDLICWAPNGRSFFIRNQAQFARELLPHYYKHNNMASFVRQLNMYGFHKKVSVDLGGLKCDRDEMEFAHQYFCKGHPYLLEHIKRKIATNKGQDPTQAPMKPELMNKMLSEVRSMRGRQEHLDSRLGAMKRENEALWRELAMLRQKHLKQQQIVNKLIHFLVTLVQPSRSGGLSVKRRYPLMIDDSTRQRNKQAKISKAQVSPTGPVIHELDVTDSDLESQYIVAEMLENHGSPAVESPEHTEPSGFEDSGMETVRLGNINDQSPNEIQLVESQNMEPKKKRVCKGKKKRKNKMPVKILIPPAENGEKPREETLMVEMSPEDSAVSIELLESNVTSSSKPIPLATVRSSKLAAMAANMSNNNDLELDLDLDSSACAEEDPKQNDTSLVKLEDILIIPEIIDEEQVKSHQTEGHSNNGNSSDPIEKEIEQLSYDSDEDQNLEGNGDEAHQSTTSENSRDNEEEGTRSLSKDLSCVSAAGLSETAYREEVDVHLETMQSELENLREILRGEGYSIDANTLLGLFGADDPMSFGVPMNPDLDPHSNREKDDDDHPGGSFNGTEGGELMAYNPSSNLLDFGDIFLGATTSSPDADVTGTSVANNYINPDPLDLADCKTSLLDSLAKANNSNSMTS